MAKNYYKATTKFRANAPGAQRVRIPETTRVEIRALLKAKHPAYQPHDTPEAAQKAFDTLPDCVREVQQVGTFYDLGSANPFVL